MSSNKIKYRKHYIPQLPTNRKKRKQKQKQKQKTKKKTKNKKKQKTKNKKQKTKKKKRNPIKRSIQKRRGFFQQLLNFPHPSIITSTVHLFLLSIRHFFLLFFFFFLVEFLVVAMKRNKTKKRKRFGCGCGFFSLKLGRQKTSGVDVP